MWVIILHWILKKSLYASIMKTFNSHPKIFFKISTAIELTNSIPILNLSRPRLVLQHKLHF